MVNSEWSVVSLPNLKHVVIDEGDLLHVQLLQPINNSERYGE